MSGSVDPWGYPMPPRESLVFCDFIAPNGLPCTSRVAGHPVGAHSTSDGRAWPIEPGTCSQGHDRRAARWCAVCNQHGSHHTDRHDQFICCRPPGDAT